MTQRDWLFVAVMFGYAVAFVAALRLVWLSWSWSRELERRSNLTTVIVDAHARLAVDEVVSIGGVRHRVTGQDEHTVTVERIRD